MAIMPWFILGTAALLLSPQSLPVVSAAQGGGDAAAIPSRLPATRLVDGASSSSRAGRFPSREERVKLYMGNWYVPPCDDYADGRALYEPDRDDGGWPVYHIQEAVGLIDNSISDNPSNSNSNNNTVYYTMECAIEPDKAFVLDRATALDCAERQGGGDPRFADRVQFRSNMYMYCLDVAQSLLPALDHVVHWGDHPREDGDNNNAETAMPPVILQFGDLNHSHVYQLINLPHFKKYRIAATPQELERVTADSIGCYDRPRDPLKDDAALQPIVWKLATRRHYGLAHQVVVKDRPWEEKLDMAIFRGQLTGSRDGFDKELSDMENCWNLRRCRLVYSHANSTLVNARLTNTRGRLPDVLNGVNLTTSSVTVRHLLRYKGIVMLEGNDVASGLKWALLSDSVVLMPTPQHTSWAMEELLRPWVHYVPLNDDDAAADVEEKMQWILDHEEDARRIAAAATLWMQDLVFHPDAAEDDRWIQEEMVRRYRRHFARWRA